MAEQLTPEQRQAVLDRGGNLLVSAAAGSGKTKVLVDRLMRYLTDSQHPADMDEFLIITYTKAAAAELRGKIADRLSREIAANPENRHLQRQMQRLYLAKISTVHSFCGDLLREYVYRLDLPGDFRVADENECKEVREQVMQSLLDACYAHAGDDAGFRAFIDSQGLGRTDSLVPEIIQKVFDSARCHLDPNGWLAQCQADCSCEGVQAPEETIWGRFLLEDLRVYLDQQIGAMSACASLAGAVAGWEKPADVLCAAVAQLQRLRECNTWQDIHRWKDVEYGRLLFPKKAGDEDTAERIKAVRDACKKGLGKKLAAFSDSAEQALSDLRQTALATQGLISLVEQFSRRYEEAKKRRRIADFSDLEHKTLDLLLGRSRAGLTAAAREVAARFREIMVDEYQDSNAVQDAIFAALTQERNNLFLVGDVKQSIYQFRLADPGIFLQKYAAFAPAGQAAAGEGRKVLLSRNFRSGGAVLEAANHVFYSCMTKRVGGLDYGDGEALQEGIPHVPLGEAEVELHAIPVERDTYEEESAYVAERIANLLDGTHKIRDGERLRPIAAEDIVILLRSPGSVGVQFHLALQRRGIPCRTGGGVDLLQTPEVGAFYALLQIISNPYQDIPLIAALTSPVFGFTAEDLASIRTKDSSRSFYEALRLDDSPKTRHFLEVLAFLRREERAAGLPELLQKILLLTRLDSIFAAQPGGGERLRNVQAFHQYALDYAAGGQRDLGQFLTHLQTLGKQGLVQAGERGGAGVQIMSIHKSKGLEFPVVFLCGLSREFNRESLRAQVLCHQELGLGLSCVDRENRIRYPAISKRAIGVKASQESLSEEMRVLYVAMTRAKDRLIMTYAEKHLENTLRDLVLRMDLGDPELLTASAVCPGEWVLLAALRRTEAGALFALAGRPQETMVSEIPWAIRLAGAPQETGTAAAQTSACAPIAQEDLDAIRSGLAFRYGHVPATAAPSKLTATQLKGRSKDQEAAENAESRKEALRPWRKLEFVSGRDTGGKDYGSAMHAAMQYVRYENCGTLAGVEAEIARLSRERFLTKEQAGLVNVKQLAAFFSTPLGEKLRCGGEILREFKFSILEDASGYGEDLDGEQILLQGVVDCALVEADGLVIVDFKTDRVTEETLPAAVERYRPQVTAYGKALSRIYEKPVKVSYLYFFHRNAIVAL